MRRWMTAVARLGDSRAVRAAAMQGLLPTPGAMRSSGDVGGRALPGRSPRPEVLAEETVVVFEQPGSDQPVGGRILLGATEHVAGAVLTRTSERPVQHAGSRFTPNTTPARTR